MDTYFLNFLFSLLFNLWLKFTLGCVRRQNYNAKTDKNGSTHKNASKKQVIGGLSVYVVSTYRVELESSLCSGVIILYDNVNYALKTTLRES